VGQTVLTKKELIAELIERNVSEIIRPEELEQLLASAKPLKVYFGVDPSSPDIHLGHAVPLWKLRQFQDLGHHIILLIGDFTAQIGDPTGKSKERLPLTHATVLANAKSYKDQAAKILQFSGKNAAQMKFNSEWLSKLTLEEVIELAGHFTVQQMIERDMYQERLKTGQPIGLHEFLYPLMVGYDSVKLDVDVEIGGNDQLFNIKAGRTLMEKVKGKKKVVLVTDLLTGSDGSKMSKSFGNIIPITATPAEMFGQLMATHDKLIEEYARMCSDMHADELDALAKRLSSAENPRDIKMDVAQRIVARYHGSERATKAKDQFVSTFSQKHQSTEATELSFTTPSILLVDLIVHAESISRSEARRLVLAGAVDVDGVVQTNPHDIILLEKPKLVKIGKHRFVRAYMKRS